MRLVSWAETDFFFEDLIRNNVPSLKKVKFTHHKSWFVNRSYLKEAIHILQQVISLAFSSRNESLILFGTNLCRIMFVFFIFRKNVIFVYNELPSFNKRTSAGILDYLIFKMKHEKIAVSSIERKTLCEDKFGVSIDIVLNNIPRLKKLNNTQRKIDKILYAGVINKHRFPEEVCQQLASINVKLDLLGVIIDPCVIDEIPTATYLGKLPYESSQALQYEYKYGLLSYSTSDYNNDYCAPIKIYEYINAGCVCVTVNNNKGLQTFMTKYPKLFVKLAEIKDYNYDFHDFSIQREQFLSEELKLLKSSVQTVLNSVE